MLALDTGPREVQVYSVYIPQSGREEEERRHAFAELDRWTEEREGKGVQRVLGDFNARQDEDADLESADTNWAMMNDLAEAKDWVRVDKKFQE
eukprot:2613982-Alexandrium_andersonii.AAC.1